MPNKIDEFLQLENETDAIIALSDYVCAQERQLGFDSLPEAGKVFYCVYWIEAEVNNGGFNQYFFNGGEYAQDAVKALETIGAKYTAQLLREAMSVFPSGVAPRDHDQCQNELLAIGTESEELLNELDTRFYEYNDPISTLLLGYMRRHREQF